MAPFVQVIHSSLIEGSFVNKADLFFSRDVGMIKQVKGNDIQELIGSSVPPEPVSSGLFVTGCLPFCLGIWRKKRR